MWLLSDFDLGHPDHISIPAKQWSQIPSQLRRKIRTIEKKGEGDLLQAYNQARRYVDFVAEATFAQERNKKKWAATVASVKAQDIGGTPAGKWSAVKASIAVRRYKENGGRYKTKTKGTLSNANWFVKKQQQKQKGDS